jgi:type I restriction enzyme S subunit
LEEGYRGYIEQALRAPIAAYQQGIVGATVAHLGKKHLDTIDVLVPPVELCEPLEEFAQQRLVLHKLIQSANEARNRLLPKLMSGEIEVEG